MKGNSLDSKGWQIPRPKKVLLNWLLYITIDNMKGSEAKWAIPKLGWGDSNTVYVNPSHKVCSNHPILNCGIDHFLHINCVQIALIME